jgi:Tfp pilus assembly protein PilO
MVRNAVSILFIAGAIAIFFFYTKPAYDGEQVLAAQGSQYDAALSKATQLQTIKQSLLSRYNSFDPNAISRLSVMLPDQVDNIRLILDLDNLAGKYGMSLQNVDISAPADAQGGTVVSAISSASQPWDSLNLQFTTRGTYEEFKQFLASLESSLRLVDLLTLTIAPSGTTGAIGGTTGATGTSGGEQVYTYSMTLQTYWLR